MCVFVHACAQHGMAADVFVLVAERYSEKALDTTLTSRSNTNTRGQQVLSIKEKITYRDSSVY